MPKKKNKTFTLAKNEQVQIQYDVGDFMQMDFEILQLQELELELNEGQFHIGTGSVIKFIGRKIIS